MMVMKRSLALALAGLLLVGLLAGCEPGPLVIRESACQLCPRTDRSVHPFGNAG